MSTSDTNKPKTRKPRKKAEPTKPANPIIKSAKTTKEIKEKVKKFFIDRKEYDINAQLYFQTGELTEYLKKLPKDSTITKDKIIAKGGVYHYIIKGIKNPY